MSRRGFSLFELMLVVILIGLVYSLVLGKVNKKKIVKINKLENLRTILSSSNNNQHIELNIYDNCKKITVLGLDKKIDIDTSIFKDIIVYKVDTSNNLKKIEFTPILVDKKVYEVCFNFTIYKNKSSSSYIVKQDNRYIVFHSYFKDSYTTPNEDEAIEYLTNQKELKEFKDELL